MMWILIGSELLVFGAALIAFNLARIGDPHGFSQAQDHLDRLSGLINVIVLLTSGLFAALAVEYARAGSTFAVRLCLCTAALLGLVFLGFKWLEYATEIAAGFGLSSGGFFTLYFLITGFHALHVIMGMIILAIIGCWPTPVNVETGTAFWHMVDLVWLLVFPVIYLIR